MNNQSLRYICFFIISFISIVTLVVSCGEDDEDSRPVVCNFVAGDWYTEEHSYGCGESDYYTAFYEVDQNDCNLKVYSNGMLFNGGINGNTIQLTGSYPEDGGTTNNKISMTVNNGAIDGTSEWTWSNGVQSCSGTTDIYGYTIDDTDSEY